MDGPLLADQRLIIKMNVGGTGVLGGTPVPTFSAALSQKRKTMPADGCAMCVQLSVFKLD